MNDNNNGIIANNIYNSNININQSKKIGNIPNELIEFLKKENPPIDIIYQGGDSNILALCNQIIEILRLSNYDLKDKSQFQLNNYMAANFQFGVILYSPQKLNSFELLTRVLTDNNIQVVYTHIRPSDLKSDKSPFKNQPDFPENKIIVGHKL